LYIAFSKTSFAIEPCTDSRSLLLGIPRKTVTLQFSVSTRAVQLWVNCFNEFGVDGLLHKASGGRPFKKELSYSSVIRYIHEMNYVMKFPRPWAQGGSKNEEERERFRLEIERLRNRSDVQLWFQDECGIEGDPKPRQRWAMKGSVPKIDYFGAHLRRSVLGAVCPENGEFFSLVFHYCNTEVFQAFLDQMAKT